MQHYGELALQPKTRFDPAQQDRKVIHHSNSQAMSGLLANDSLVGQIPYAGQLKPNAALL